MLTIECFLSLHLMVPDHQGHLLSLEVKVCISFLSLLFFTNNFRGDLLGKKGAVRAVIYEAFLKPEVLTSPFLTSATSHKLGRCTWHLSKWRKLGVKEVWEEHYDSVLCLVLVLLILKHLLYILIGDIEWTDTWFGDFKKKGYLFRAIESYVIIQTACAVTGREPVQDQLKCQAGKENPAEEDWEGAVSERGRKTAKCGVREAWREKGFKEEFACAVRGEAGHKQKGGCCICWHGDS